MMFVGFLNLGEIAGGFSTFRQDLAVMFKSFQTAVRSRRDPAEILKDTNILPRLRTSRRDLAKI